MKMKILLIAAAGAVYMGPATWANDHTVTYIGNLAVEADSQTPQDAVWFEGALNEGIFPNDLQGHGSKVLWFPAIAAFRAGNLATWYDDLEGGTNIGQFSTAFGGDTVASGLSSFAAGRDTLATGSYSAAFGRDTQAGNYSAAFGENTEAGWRSAAFGYDTHAASHSIVAGIETSAGGWSAAFGMNTSAWSAGSLATGEFTSALGGYSVALNSQTIASGNYSFAGGRYTDAESHSEFVIGQYNKLSDDAPDPTGWQEEDFLFVIGNGTSEEERSNAMVVKKDGDSEFSGTIRVEEAAGDISMGQFQE